VGQYELHAMRSSLLSFQIGGGIVILLFSLTMVLGAAETSPQPEHPGGSVRSLAVYPMAVPVLAGPGSILTIMVLMDNNRGSFPDQLITVLALAVLMFAHRWEDVAWRDMAELIIPPRLRDAFSRSDLGRSGSILGRRIEVTGQRADGTQFPVELTLLHVVEPRHAQPVPG
jgi:hypothetical protein